MAAERQEKIEDRVAAAKDHSFKKTISHARNVKLT